MNSQRSKGSQSAKLLLVGKTGHELDDKIRKAKGKGYWVTGRYSQNGKYYAKLRCR